jgi:hypothetical protein
MLPLYLQVTALALIAACTVEVVNWVFIYRTERYRRAYAALEKAGRDHGES